jgi:hypothetical protein
MLTVMYRTEDKKKKSVKKIIIDEKEHIDWGAGHQNNNDTDKKCGSRRPCVQEHFDLGHWNPRVGLNSASFLSPMTIFPLMMERVLLKSHQLMNNES